VLILPTNWVKVHVEGGEWFADKGGCIGEGTLVVCMQPKGKGCVWWCWRSRGWVDCNPQGGCSGHHYGIREMVAPTSGYQ
jgi:hypothetical protein